MTDHAHRCELGPICKRLKIATEFYMCNADKHSVEQELLYSLDTMFTEWIPALKGDKEHKCIEIYQQQEDIKKK